MKIITIAIISIALVMIGFVQVQSKSMDEKMDKSDEMATAQSMQHDTMEMKSDGMMEEGDMHMKADAMKMGQATIPTDQELRERLTPLQ